MKSFVSGESGQSLVEFALVLPLFLLIITGIFDVGRAVWQENTLAYAAREGTRYAIVHGSASDNPAHPGSEQDVVDVVRSAALGVYGVAVDVDWPDTVAGQPCNARSCRVSVDASAPFIPIASAGLLGGTLQFTLRAGSMLVIQR